MKLSLQTLRDSFISGVRALFSRFPVTTVLIIIEFIGLCILIEHPHFKSYTNEKDTYLLGLILMGNVSLIFSSITVQLTSEKLNLDLVKKVLFYAGVLALVGSIAASLITINIQSYEYISTSFTGNVYRLLILVLVSFLSVFSVPFIKDGGSRDWWNFYITTVFRASVSILYSIAIYIGLSLALLALDTFWSITFFDNQYFIIMVFSYVLVAPLHFLHDVYDFRKVTELIDLPKYLSILVKYILTPLIAIYVVILYPYIFSFPFREEWPANEATFIIIALHGMIYAGVITFYGVKDDSGDAKFKRLFTRITSALSVPTLLFWVYSLYLRIDAYGITVNRFVLMAIILWFIGTSVYLLLSKSSKPQYIVFALLSVIFASFYLPFTSFYWAEKSQIARIIEIAKEEGIYVDGKIGRAERNKVEGNGMLMGDATNLVNGYSGVGELKEYWSEEVLDKVTINSFGYAKVLSLDSTYLSHYNFSELYFNDTDYSNPIIQQRYVSVNLDSTSVPFPDGYKSVLYIDNIPYDSYDGNEFELFRNTYTVTKIDVDSDSFSTTPFYNNPKFEGVYLEKEAGGNTYYTVNPELMTLRSSDSVFVISSIGYSLDPKGEKVESINYVSGYLFVK
ncbi:MAG TPA: DUF4153 domain-containing protein [Candidatus Dojkabacteria bacterium]|nr:DUF4153 domain-containing protein [Candidatus Dojkabacteria bacterium]